MRCLDSAEVESSMNTTDRDFASKEWLQPTEGEQSDFLRTMNMLALFGAAVLGSIVGSVAIYVASVW